MNKINIWIIIAAFFLAACENNQIKEKTTEIIPEIKQSPPLQQVDSNTNKTSVLPQKNVPLQAIATLEFYNYYDKSNGISLKYPKTWTKEMNKYVPFKITAPQENSTDSMKENFYYVIFDEKPNELDLLNSKKNEELSLEQMNQKTCNDLLITKPNRRNTKIESNTKIIVNGVPAYEIISTGIVSGYAMKYRILILKKGSKQHYLFFASEQYTYNKYKDYADMLFSSYYIK